MAKSELLSILMQYNNISKKFSPVKGKFSRNFQFFALNFIKTKNLTEKPPRSGPVPSLAAVLYRNQILQISFQFDIFSFIFPASASTCFSAALRSIPEKCSARARLRSFENSGPGFSPAAIRSPPVTMGWAARAR